jgi:rod shape-determining protein MreC
MSMVRPSAPLRAALQRAAPALFIALSVAIVALGRADPGVFAAVRIRLADDSAPVLAALSRPAGAAAAAVERVRSVVLMYQDNLRLERDNERLLKWQQVALKLSNDNQQLRGLLHVVPDNAVSFETARIIGGSGGSFVRTLMIDAGSDRGAARGEAVIAGDGLVGRLTEVGNRAARVLLVTDLNSRIPVVVEGSHVKAILAGDNSVRPRLLYASDLGAIKIGDRVVTSGDGGVFPPGLPVGVVAGLVEGVPRIEPYVEPSRLDYVMIVDYGLSSGLPQVPVASRPARYGRRLNADEAGVP